MGGRVAGVHATTRTMLKHGHEIHVLTNDDVAASRFELAGAQVVKPPVWCRALHPFDILSFVHLAILCRWMRFDLVITHTSKAGLVGRLAARLAGVPHIVHHAHAFRYQRLRSGVHRRLWLVLERIAARAGELTITASADIRSWAIRERVDQPMRILTILDGVNVEQFDAADRGALRGELGFTGGTRIIGAFCLLEAGSGCEELLKAMPSVLARHPCSRLVIVGDGSLKVEFSQEAALMGLADRVRFLRPQVDSITWLPAFDVLVQPSALPKDPTSLLEAMGAGCAIVACNTALNRELVKHGQTALLVPPHNARALGVAISHLLDDSNRMRAIGLRARSEALRRFSVGRMVEQNFETYRRLVEQVPTPGESNVPAAKGAAVGRTG